MSATALLGVIVRWLLFAAVLGTTGAAAFRFLVLSRIGDVEFRDAVARRTAAMATVLAVVGLGAAIARLPLQVIDLRDASVPLMPQVQALGFHTMWGAQWSFQVVVLVTCLLALAAAQSGSARAWKIAAVAAVLAAASPAFAGHAIGSERLSTLAVISDILHVLAASAWLGGMLYVLGSLALAHGERGAGGVNGAAVVTAFSSVALASVAILIATGGFAAWLHVGSIRQLWQSRYGVVLCIKLLAVIATAATGAWNWRQAGPRLRASGVVGPMWRSVRVELLWGILVILATAVLVAVPEPGME